jgi:hypothetical protein
VGHSSVGADLRSSVRTDGCRYWWINDLQFPRNGRFVAESLTEGVTRLRYPEDSEASTHSNREHHAPKVRGQAATPPTLPHRGDTTDTACVVLSTTVMNAQASA